MKIKIVQVLVAVILSFSAALSSACVGKTLYVGALDKMEDTIMAEFLVLYINARTGSEVIIRFFENNEQLYKALQSEVKEKRVDLVVEDTKDAVKVLGRERIADLDREYIETKKAYEKKFDIIWLDPFIFTNLKKGHKSVAASLVRRDVLTSFPLLPRILNKLAGAIDDQTFSQLMGQAKSQEPKSAVKNFLQTQELI